MKIKLLIATTDKNYAERLSALLTEKYADKLDVSVCTQQERLSGLLANNKFEAALIDPYFGVIPGIDSIQLPLMLIDETGNRPGGSFKTIQKYQRVSSIAGNIMEYYAEIGTSKTAFKTGRAHITAVWSPSGGSGKTSVALGYAANRVLGGTETLYLCMENFSSIPVYFPDDGRSISKVFEKLDTNVQMLLLGVRRQDAGSGISYFCSPENYEDINVLSIEDVEIIIDACTLCTQELVIDLPCRCDERTRQILNIADTVLLVTDSSVTAQTKLNQFMNQHNVFESIKDKTILVNNKGAKTTANGVLKIVNLPYVQTTDAVSVYKTLSGSSEW